MAEIERLRALLPDANDCDYLQLEFARGQQDAFTDFEEFIRTLEVKEVDSEKVFLDEYSRFSNDTDAMDYAFPIDLADYRDFAEHFFKLGMQVSNKAQKGG